MSVNFSCRAVHHVRAVYHPPCQSFSPCTSCDNVSMFQFVQSVWHCVHVSVHSSLDTVSMFQFLHFLWHCVNISVPWTGVMLCWYLSSCTPWHCWCFSFCTPFATVSMLWFLYSVCTVSMFQFPRPMRHCRYFSSLASVTLSMFQFLDVISTESAPHQALDSPIILKEGYVLYTHDRLMACRTCSTGPYERTVVSFGIVF